MNAKQSLRAASKRIEELEYYNAMASADIKDYNAVIEHMINGGCPCDWCEDIEECQLNAKGETGCTEWMLRTRKEQASDTDDQHRGVTAVNALDA